MHVCVCERGEMERGSSSRLIRSAELPVMSPPSLSLDKISSRGHFKHVIITSFMLAQLKLLDENVCSSVYAQMRTCRFHCGQRQLVSACCIHVVYFVSSRRCSVDEMKCNEEKCMLGQELALFTHHHKDWSSIPFLSLDSALTWEILHLKCMQIFLWNVHRAPNAAAQLGNAQYVIIKYFLQNTYWLTYITFY